MSKDVDLSYYAEKCKGYSGADLQALLYNAHLEAIHGEIDDKKILEKKVASFEGGFGVDSKNFVSFNLKSQKRKISTSTAAEKAQIVERVCIVHWK